MADEARIVASLSINAGNLQYQSRPTSFTVDVTGRKGPTPGAITATPQGVVVDLSQLTIPGLYRITSLDTDEGNYVEFGIYDPQIDVFYPKDEVGPGESYVGKFSRNLLEEYSGTGTGTTGATNKLMVKSFNANAVVVIEAFEK